MPDISMCLNHECPLRGKCYRYLAYPSYWQAYGDYKPDGETCEYLWSVEGSRVRTLEEADERNIKGAL